MSGLLNIACNVTGSPFSFNLAAPVQITKKPDTGELQKITAIQQRSDLLDAPWSFMGLTGMAVPKAYLREHDSYSFEEKNIDTRWAGMWCLGPKGRTTTDIANARRVTGYAEGLGALWYWATAGTASNENIAYLVASTATWTNATASADWVTTVGGSMQFPRGMVSHNVSGAERLYAVVLIPVTAGGMWYQLIYTTDKTTWTIIDHVNEADTPTGSTANSAFYLESLNVAGTQTLYTLAQSAAGAVVTLRQSINNGTTWTSSTGGTLATVSTPRALVKFKNSAGAEQIFVFLQEGIYRYTGSTFVQEFDFRGDLDTNNGLFPTPALGGKILAVPQGRKLWAYYWSSLGRFERYDLSEGLHALPAYRIGRILALSTTQNFLWVAIGGESASTTAGVYAIDAQGVWHGPLYDIGTANRQVRAMYGSSQDDNIMRLHIAVDNGTANDTDQIYLQDIDTDPRYVTSYQHAPSGSLVLPKNARYLDELTARWRYLEATGTGFTSNNKITAVYAVADSSPIGADGSWGSSIGSITANAGSVNFTATPTGTGQNARALQVRIDLAGTSDASPYVEVINIGVKKNLPVKMIRTFVIDPHSQGTTRPMQVVLDEIETLITSATDMTVTYGQETTALTMEFWRYGEPIAYEYKTYRNGTVQDHADIQRIILKMVDT